MQGMGALCEPSAGWGGEQDVPAVKCLLAVSWKGNARLEDPFHGSSENQATGTLYLM